MRKNLTATITILVFLAACQLTTTPTPLQAPTATPQRRAPLALAEVKQSAKQFGTLANALVASWNARDAQAVRAIFTEDARMIDKTYYDVVKGPDNIAGMIASVAAFGPDWQARSTDKYIGVGNGLSVDEYWDLKLGGHSFTRADPVVEVDRLQIRQDRIARWDLFYSLDSLEKFGEIPQSQLDEALALLSAYQAAWSSGDAQAVAALYAVDAVREDPLFGESQAGRWDIATFAKTFFGWYQAVKWTRGVAFGEGHGEVPLTGSTYTIRVSDLSGQPCDIQAAVLLLASENQISHEIMYYELGSLVKCGWAK